MTAEILAVGTEILLGEILNTNAQYLAQKLSALGISCYRHTAVGDNAARIQSALANAFTDADIVIATGGLGPTDDDLTKEACAAYFDMPLKTHAPSLNAIKEYFSRMKRPMTRNNEKQALIPDGAVVLDNAVGTAPGCIMEKNGKAIIVLPGPPFEMRNMFESGVLPYLKGVLSEQNAPVFAHRELKLVGIGESAACDAIDDIIKTQTNPTIAPYAGNAECRLRLMASAASEEAARELIKPVADEIYRRLGKFIYGEDKATLESVVVEALDARRLSLSTAESCTGGLLAGRLVNVSGVSEVFREGAVTYANEAKIGRLGVKPETLNEYGAVSEQCAVEMAKGIAEKAGTDVGVATTGIAGPTGGTAEKPVGLVYIAIYFDGAATVERHVINGGRNIVRERAVTAALNLIRKTIGGLTND